MGWRTCAHCVRPVTQMSPKIKRKSVPWKGNHACAASSPQILQTSCYVMLAYMRWLAQTRPALLHHPITCSHCMRFFKERLSHMKAV